MRITRRDFLRASSALAAALGLKLPTGLAAAQGLTGNGGPTVVWLQAQSCSGCSVSLMNSIYYTTVDNLLLSTVNLSYHPTLMAAAGGRAVSAAQTARETKGYVLVVEGAVPTAANGEYCYLWPGTTALAGVKDFAANAGFILAVGSCAAYGGMAAGKPNPTGVKSVGSLVGNTRVINIPGCPAHPDWIVGTVAYLIANGKAPKLDSLRRPLDYFSRTVHSRCPYADDGEPGDAEEGCLYWLGCRGPVTYGDCPSRQWNSGKAGTAGVNWCVFSRSPCQGCTEPKFPDGMSPFYTKAANGGVPGAPGGGGGDDGDGGGDGGDDHETDRVASRQGQPQQQPAAQDAGQPQDGTTPAEDSVEAPVGQKSQLRAEYDQAKQQRRQAYEQAKAERRTQYLKRYGKPIQEEE